MTQSVSQVTPFALSADWCRDSSGKNHSFDQLIKRITAFHGYPAPGMVVGIKMVDVALSAIPAGILFDAVTETGNCLPDAVQMLTPCTAGNGWLKMLDLGRFALALYDKHTGEGVRVFLDARKVPNWPEIDIWFFKRKPKAEQNSRRLLDEIRQAGAFVMTTEKVYVDKRLMAKTPVGPRGICPQCLESYPKNHGKLCRACQGASPYQDRKND